VRNAPPGTALSPLVTGALMRGLSFNFTDFRSASSNDPVYSMCKNTITKDHNSHCTPRVERTVDCPAYLVRRKVPTFS
jgi:hypothetical protein